MVSCASSSTGPHCDDDDDAADDDDDDDDDEAEDEGKRQEWGLETSDVSPPQSTSCRSSLKRTKLDLELHF